MINRKQLYTNQTSLRWKKVNKIRHFSVIADLNVAQKKKYVVVIYLLFLLIFFSVYVSFIIVKNCGFVNGICNFSNIFSIKKCYF